MRGFVCRYCFHAVGFVVALCLIPGCFSQVRGKIEGTRWTNLAMEVHGHAVPKDLIQMEFLRDGNLRYVVKKKSHAGSYSFGTGSYVYLYLNPPLERVAGFWEKISIEDRRLTLKDGSGTSLVFERVE